MTSFSNSTDFSDKLVDLHKLVAVISVWNKRSIKQKISLYEGRSCKLCITREQ